MDKGPLLVVMPNGFGLTRLGRPLPGEAALATLGSPANTGLAGAAITAVRRLAAAAGHPLPVSSVEAAARREVERRDPVARVGRRGRGDRDRLGLSLRARPLRTDPRSAEAAP